MSYYAVVDDFRSGMPQTILSSFRPRGIACHTTEGAEGEAGAVGTILFLAGNPGRNASYHELWYPKLGGFEARRIVRPDRAAHSMNPAQPSPWSPEVRVRRILGDRWGDPNAYSYAVSVAGSTNHTVPRLINDHPGFMEGARRRTRELLERFSSSLSPDPLFNHGEGQNNRYDWGLLLRPALLEDDEMDWVSKIKPLSPYIATLDANARVRNAPSLNSSGSFLIPHTGREVTIIGEVEGDAYNNSTRWLAFQSGTWGIGATHEANEVGRRELTGGLTKADVDKAVLEAKAASEDTIATLKTKISAAQAALR